jgi:hypothetical protein
VALPYPEVFLAVLVVYLAYSVWAPLDPRYPIAMGLALLLGAAVADGLGRTAAANAYAGYVFFLLAGGIALLIVEAVRSSVPRGARPPPSRARGNSPANEAPDPRDRPAHDPLH